MKISIVTPSYNHAEFLPKAIESVLGQTGSFELDYVVLDGGSNDTTIDVLKSFGSRLCWHSQEDNGQIDAINKGLLSASGDLVGWLNSDDLLLPGALQRVADAFLREPSAQWVFGDCIVVDRNGQEIRKWVSAYKRFQAKRYSRKRLLVSNFISQMTVFWRREVIDKVGLLDESLPLAFDYDYWLRLASICDPVYIDAPQAAFRWYTTSKSGSNVRDQCREDELIAARHGIRMSQAAMKRMQNWLRIAAYQWLPV